MPKISINATTMSDLRNEGKKTDPIPAPRKVADIKKQSQSADTKSNVSKHKSGWF